MPLNDTVCRRLLMRFFEKTKYKVLTVVYDLLGLLLVAPCKVLIKLLAFQNGMFEIRRRRSV